jgi:hypothetical protein
LIAEAARSVSVMSFHRLPVVTSTVYAEKMSLKPRVFCPVVSSTKLAESQAVPHLVEHHREQVHQARRLVVVEPEVEGKLVLKRARMSKKPGLRSTPARLSASAEWYQVAGYSAPGKSRKMNVVPAEPSTLGASGSKVASTKMSFVGCSFSLQIAAARRKTTARCWPRVVPGFPRRALPASGR